MTTTTSNIQTSPQSGDSFLTAGMSTLEYTSKYLELSLLKEVGPAKLVFTKASGVVGNTVEFAIEYDKELDTNGGDKYKATVVSGSNLGASVVASSLGGLLAKAGLSLAVTVGGTIGIGGTAAVKVENT